MSSLPPSASASAPLDQTDTQSSSVKEFEFESTSLIMALANSAIDAVLGPTPTATSDANCSVHSEAFHHCLNSHEFDDMGKCHYYVDMLADCCKKSTC